MIDLEIDFWSSTVLRWNNWQSHGLRAWIYITFLLWIPLEKTDWKKIPRLIWSCSSLKRVYFINKSSLTAINVRAVDGSSNLLEGLHKNQKPIERCTETDNPIDSLIYNRLPWTQGAPLNDNHASRPLATILRFIHELVFCIECDKCAIWII